MALPHTQVAGVAAAITEIAVGLLVLAGLATRLAALAGLGLNPGAVPDGELVCPCHGSIFDSRTRAVRQGPAVQPLAVRHVLERAGSIYALPS